MNGEPHSHTYVLNLVNYVCRTMTIINDGQTWRRLAHIHDLLGNSKEGDEARYMAWQLGIGQGGFGGPI